MLNVLPRIGPVLPPPDVMQQKNKEKSWKMSVRGSQNMGKVHTIVEGKIPLPDPTKHNSTHTPVSEVWHHPLLPRALVRS